MPHQPESLLVPTMERPPLTRSRSSTTPSKRPHPTLDVSAARPDAASRSHSYLSPVAPKPRPAQTLPNAASSSRLHLPGTSALHRHDRDYRHSSKYRHHHTQSDVLSGTFRSHRRDRSEGLPHLTAGLVAEKERRAGQAKQSNELSGADASELRRIASNRSHLGRAGRTHFDEATIRRANSDPKMRVQQRQRSQVEILLDRAEAQKMANRAAVSQIDVDKIRKTTAEAEEELQRRLAAVNKTSVDIMRTLDYTYYNLLEKVGNLVDIVQSFQSLSSQTKDVIANFTKEATMLEKDVKAKIETCKKGFDEREVRVRRLEERGARANAKAQELGTRLEAARHKVEAWEKKEGAERRRRSWFWRSTWTILIVVLLVLYFGLTWREWQSEAGIVRMALMDDDAGGFNRLNQSLFLDRHGVRKMEVPDDVKSVLSGVRERRTSRSPPVHHPSTTKATDGLVDSRKEEDPRLSIFDEL